MAVKIDFKADTKHAAKSVTQLKGTIEQLKKAANASMSAGSMKSVQQNIDATTKKVKELRKQYSQFQDDLSALSERTGTHATKGNYSKLISAEMAKSKEALKTWKKQLEEYSDPKFANNTSIQDAIERTKGHISYEKRNQAMLTATKERLDNGAGTNLASDVKSAERELAGYEKQAAAITKANEKVNASFAKVGSAAVGVLASSLKVAASALASVAQKTTSFVTTVQKGFLKAIPSAIKLVKKFGTAVGKHFGVTFAVLRRMARVAITRLTRMAIMSLFNGFTEGMQNLARYSKDAMAAMSSFSTSSLYLKNQLAATFSPALNAVAAAFEYITNAAAAAMQAISRFIALIGGKSSYTKAIRYNVDYAKSLDKAGGGAGELKNQLLGFDKINRLEENGGGGSGKLYSPEEALKMFETVDIEETLADMYDLGAKLANTIADSLGRIPWDKIKQKSQSIGQGIVDYINGALSSDKLASALGTTVAEAFKTLVDFKFDVEYDIEWNTLGKNVGDAINTAIGNISEDDWKRWGYTLVGKLRMAFDFLAGLVTETDFESVGNAMVNAISGAVEALFSKSRTLSVINPKKQIPIALGDDSVIVGSNDSVTRSNTSIAQSIVDFITGAINGAAEMLSEVSDSDLLTVGGHIQDYFVEAVGKVNWHLVGEAISGGFKLIWTNVTEYLDFDDDEKTEIATSLSTTINTILENLKTVDWSKGAEIVTDGIDILTETVNGVDSDGLAEVIGNILTAAINGAGDLISSFVELGKAVGEKVIGAIQSWWSGDGKGETISAIQGLFTSDDGGLDVGKIGLIALTLSGFNISNGTSLLGMLKTVIIGFLGLKALSGGDEEGSGEIDIGSVGKIALTVLGFNLMTKSGGTLLSLLSSEIMDALGVSGSGILTAGATGLVLTVSVVLADAATRGIGGFFEKNAEALANGMEKVRKFIDENVLGGSGQKVDNFVRKKIEETGENPVVGSTEEALTNAFKDGGKSLKENGIFGTLFPKKPKQVEGSDQGAKIGDRIEAGGKMYIWSGKEWIPDEPQKSQNTEPTTDSALKGVSKKGEESSNEKGMLLFGEIDVFAPSPAPEGASQSAKAEKDSTSEKKSTEETQSKLDGIKEQIEAMKEEYAKKFAKDSMSEYANSSSPAPAESVEGIENDVHIIAQSNKVNNQSGGSYVQMSNKVNTTGVNNGVKKTNSLIEGMMGSLANILTMDEMNALVSRINTLKSAVQSLKDGIGSGGRISIGISNRLGSTISSTFKNMMNKFIDSINNDAITKLNNMISTLKSNTYTASAFASVGMLKSIPKLAQGAVIPANNEFLAILGDQKQGTNIEAPLDTIVEAMMLALGSSGMTASAIATAVKQGMKGMSFKVDGRALGRVVADNINSNRVAEGKLPLNL